ncbi:MAG: hypothetical protein U1F30_02775 [Steroidobacteraceae bacterium]
MLADAVVWLSLFVWADPNGDPGFLAGMIGVGCAPACGVAVVGLLTRWGKRLLPALAAMLLADIVAFLSVFVWPSDAQSALLLLFMPLWNCLVVLPAALLGSMVVRWTVRRWQARKPSVGP